MSPWNLPTQKNLGGHIYILHTDYRDILEIISYLEDPDRPEYLRWRIALALFYGEDIQPEYMQEAMEYLAEFIACGEKEDKPGPKLLDWEQDASVIVAEINKVAGMEIRNVKFLHWWTFTAFFRGIGEGQLSTLVSIRDKLRRGKKLEKWERDFYRANKAKVDLKQKYSAEELAEQERLKKLLGE